MQVRSRCSNACALILLGVLSTSCAGGASSASSSEQAATSDEAQLSPNDVSYLFPFRNGSNPGGAFAQLVALDHFLSADLFAQALSAAGAAHPHDPRVFAIGPDGNIDTPLDLERRLGPVTLGASNLASWRVVSFRADPCAPPPVHQVPLQLTSDGRLDDDAERRVSVDQCNVELRLVAQPFRGAPDGDVRASDSGIHLIYRFPGDAAARADLITALRDLKKASPADTAGLLRAPHPGLGADRDGAFHARVASFLDTFTQRGALSQIALLLLGRLPASSPVLDGTWKFFFGTVDSSGFRLRDMQQTATPEPINVVHALNRATDNRFVAPPARFPALTPQEIFGEDVHRATARTVTCVDCHDEPADIAKRDNFYNLRAFGYFEAVPAISGRTRQESEAVARYINDLDRR